ncbi:MAG: Fic family protein [Candidatus Dormiibacterota bacterium]
MSKFKPARGHPRREDIYRRVAGYATLLEAQFGGLPTPDLLNRVWRKIWFEEAHNSTAIEGNTLVLKEVEALLAANKPVGEKQLKDYMEVRGYADAAEWVYGQARGASHWGEDSLITMTELRNIHHLAMTPVWDIAPHQYALPGEEAGGWRRHNVEPFPDGMTPPDFTMVSALISDWIKDANAITREEGSLMERLAASHERFERIHPFLDGNGRSGRLALNLVLVRLGYPPAVIHFKQRNHYRAGLTAAMNGNPGPLGEVIARGVMYSLNQFLFRLMSHEQSILPLTALVSEDLSFVALRTAASRGRLEALQADDGEWHSTQQWVADYRQHRWVRRHSP